ncbi:MULTISPECIES: hypothetical protein [unclassified Streptomyces]|uniref:hypothetical protein n=1 Tax=unclassified Streptomyces TaxID=2593676 RepID=UPI0003A87E1E|nr:MULTISPECIES: hypothetical protein [unclassified Streptomyces]
MSELPFGVRAVVAVPGRRPCTGAVRLLATEGGRGVLLGEEGDQGTVLLDVGRLGEETTSLLRAADQVVLVARGGAEPLTHVSAYGLEAEAYAGRLTLAVVGPCPYPAKEIAEALCIKRVVFLPWDAKAVSAMSRGRRGALRTTGLRVPPLMAAVKVLARQLAGTAESDAGLKVVEQWRPGPVQVPVDDGSAS